MLTMQRIRESKETHKENPVTSLAWDCQVGIMFPFASLIQNILIICVKNGRLFSADDCGRVCCVQYDAPSTAGNAKWEKMFQETTTTMLSMLASGTLLLDVEKKVTQMDYNHGENIVIIVFMYICL